MNMLGVCVYLFVSACISVFDVHVYTHVNVNIYLPVRDGEASAGDSGRQKFSKLSPTVNSRIGSSTSETFPQ